MYRYLILSIWSIEFWIQLLIYLKLLKDIKSKYCIEVEHSCEMMETRKKKSKNKQSDHPNFSLENTQWSTPKPRKPCPKYKIYDGLVTASKAEGSSWKCNNCEFKSLCEKGLICRFCFRDMSRGSQGGHYILL